MSPAVRIMDENGPGVSICESGVINDGCRIERQDRKICPKNILCNELSLDMQHWYGEGYKSQTC